MRRAARSAGIAAAVAVMVLANVPATRIDEVLRPLGLGQGWSLFAPDPGATQTALEADIRLADGHVRRWRPPGLDPAFQEGAYRWQHWARDVIRDERSGTWERAARWIARTAAGDARPVRVTLRRRWAALAPPGAAGRRLRWSEFDFFVLELR